MRSCSRRRPRSPGAPDRDIAVRGLGRSGPSPVRVRFSALAERLRGSLFVVPTVYLVAGIVIGQASIKLDDIIGDRALRLPFVLTSTVQSARAVLTTIAGATITVAGISFSVSLLTIQLASSQYSPRVVGGLFRDSFNKRVIGVVVGTFSYCLIVLRAVRSPAEQQGQAVIPNVSVAIGVVLGIAAVLAIIAFISHNAHAMDITEILGGLTRDAIQEVDRQWSADELEASPVQQPEVVPTGASLTVELDQHGWVQLLDQVAIVKSAPEGATVRLETAVGRYALTGSPLCTIWPEPPDRDETTSQVRDAVRVGETRTLQQDPAYGVRQLADVALKALSPGVNDPTTAQDAIFHMGAVVRTLLQQEPRARDLTLGDRRLILEQVGGHEDLLSLAFDEIRLVAAEMPTVCVYLLECLSLIARSIDPKQHEANAGRLRHHADLVVRACERTNPSPEDIAPLHAVYARRFGPYADPRR